MKTGFIQGFVNLMKPKTYPYHGILNQCGVQPEIPPYIGPDMKPVGQEWVLAWEGSIYAGWRQYFRFYDTGFLKSSDKYLCVDPYSQGYNKYYFTEVYMWQIGAGEPISLFWGDGINCKIDWIFGKYLYIYKAWFNHEYYGMGMLWRAFNAGPSSTARVWKSLTGEYPGYYPMPQKEIIRV